MPGRAWPSEREYGQTRALAEPRARRSPTTTSFDVAERSACRSPRCQSVEQSGTPTQNGNAVLSLTKAPSCGQATVPRSADPHKALLCPSPHSRPTFDATFSQNLRHPLMRPEPMQILRPAPWILSAGLHVGLLVALMGISNRSALDEGTGSDAFAVEKASRSKVSPSSVRPSR